MEKEYNMEECEGCLFRCGLGTCDFMAVTRKARSRICSPGNECVVRAETMDDYHKICRRYISGRIPVPPAKQTTGGKPKNPGLDESRAWQLYKVQRLNDKQIAEQLGVNVKRVRNWRLRNGLEANFKHWGHR